jgi:DNA (cytosine-5)-methyltransferase 1
VQPPMAGLSYPETLDVAWRAHLAPRAADAPTVISAFAGCGGSSLGYSMAGFRELLAIEWDAVAVETLRANFPDVTVYHGDIAALTTEACLALANVGPGALDVLDGSPPCQGFSVAGQRVLDDPRNQLFREYVRLLRGKMRLVFVEVLRALRASGYRVSARVVNAMYFGVPQDRRRMIFVGIRDDLGVEPSHPVAVGLPLNAGDAIEGVVIPDAERAMLLAAGARYESYREWRRLPFDKDRTVLGYRSLFTARKQNPRRPARTITRTDASLGMAATMHWLEPRRASVGEYKRYGAFPDRFRLPPEWDRAVALIGNSVPPLFMRAVAQHIRSEILDRLAVPA